MGVQFGAEYAYNPGDDVQLASRALDVLGMPGLTAHMDLLDIGQPKTGDTVVLAGTSGAVGSLIGQIDRIQGARALGIAGGAKKCRYVVGVSVVRFRPGPPRTSSRNANHHWLAFLFGELRVLVSGLFPALSQMGNKQADGRT